MHLSIYILSHMFSHKLFLPYYFQELSPTILYILNYKVLFFIRVLGEVLNEE